MAHHVKPVTGSLMTHSTRGSRIDHRHATVNLRIKTDYKQRYRRIDEDVILSNYPEIL